MPSGVRRIAMVLTVCAAAPASAADTSPVGRWITYSDRTHAPSGIIEIRLERGALQGTVVEMLNRPASAPPAICRKCDGPLKDAPVIGMTIMWGLKNDGGSTWDNGSILDPNSGDVYSARLELENGGHKLLVRGYLGISLLGRTQEWVRQN